MENYFTTLSNVKCEVEKKNGLNYISWSDGWTELKKIHPDATYEKVKNGDSYLFRSGTGGSVECNVTVNGVTHTADLAITDFKNQEIKYESIKSTDIQNTLQRAFAKAIAMHGIGLYVYRGEDFPEDNGEEVVSRTKTIANPEIKKEDVWFNESDFEVWKKSGFDYSMDAWTQYMFDNGFTRASNKIKEQVLKHVNNT